MHATLFRAALAAAVLSAGLSTGAPAQTPTADELIQKNVAARGGVDRMKAITTMRHTRTMGTPFSNVEVVLIRQRPNRLRVEQTPPGRPGHRAEYVGLDKVGGKPAHHLKLTLKSGAERHVYLDPVTFLERRHTGSLRTPADQAVPYIMDFSDWREVNGVRFPFAMDEDREAMGQTYAIYVESIEINVPVDAAAFAAPVVK